MEQQAVENPGGVRIFLAAGYPTRMQGKHSLFPAGRETWFTSQEGPVLTSTAVFFIVASQDLGFHKKYGLHLPWSSDMEPILEDLKLLCLRACAEFFFKHMTQLFIRSVPFASVVWTLTGSVSPGFQTEKCFSKSYLEILPGIEPGAFCVQGRGSISEQWVFLNPVA